MNSVRSLPGIEEEEKVRSPHRVPEVAATAAVEGLHDRESTTSKVHPRQLVVLLGQQGRPPTLVLSVRVLLNLIYFFYIATVMLFYLTTLSHSE